MLPISLGVQVYVGAHDAVQGVPLRPQGEVTDFMGNDVATHSLGFDNPQGDAIRIMLLELRAGVPSW